MPDLSVIIATRNRAAFLERCLVSLCEQTLDPAHYEICVVHNAGSDDTPAVVARIAGCYPERRLFLVDEPVAGLSRARNRGLAATTGEYVAYTDDDATVPADWLVRIAARFAEGGADCAIVGGEIDPVWGAPKPDWLTPAMQKYLTAGTGLGDVARYLSGDECVCECNAVYRRAALQKAGGFPEQLGRIGDLLLSGENVVESVIRQQGGRAFFDPAIRVRHHIHADRLTPLWFRQRFFWQGITGYAVRQYQARHGVPVTQEAFLNLPLKKEDWGFINKDTSENLEDSLFLFQSLGFALALTGLMPVEG
ncbi:MAG: glycosyltransferase [Alphaproteobacteria bacterium]|nr:glycosyltransferase [Alphaproteobacteria bacterium]